MSMAPTRISSRAASKVVAIGELDGTKVEVGNVVVFAKFSGTEIELDGEDLLILDAEDVLGVVEE